MNTTSDQFIKIVGLIVILGFFLYLAIQWLRFHMRFVEGLANPASTTGNGIGSAAASYAVTLKNQVTQLHNDILLVNNKEYNKEYGNIILSMDDYINALMLKTVLNINATAEDVDVNLELFKKLNELNSAKLALNNVLKYVDSN